MKSLFIAAIAAFLLITVLPAFAEPEQPSCAGKPLVEVISLVSLPDQVRALLGANEIGLGGIADRGKRFNEIDSVDGRLPMRRFVGGGVNESCVVVAYEHGGRAYSVRLVAFEFANAQWKVARTASMRNAEYPQSLQDLVDHINN